MDNATNIPVITSLVVDEAPDPNRSPKLTPPWKTPFLELLGLLKVIDNSQPTPRVDGQRFCFQPSHDLSEISRVFLSVSTASSIQHDIDLETLLLLDSDAVPPALTQLQEYANHVLRRIQLFRDRLLERAVIKDPSCFLRVDLFTCPLCLGPLVSCVDCDSQVACSQAVCPGSLVVDCEQCHEHDRMACHPCLAKTNTIPPIVCCPVCQDWCCREDADWCAGLITHPALGTKELAELSHKCEWDCESIVRSHPPKHGPCRSCTDHLLTPGWKVCCGSMEYLKSDRCPSQTPLMMEFCLLGAFCPECLDQYQGRNCACKLRWICDTCFVIGNKSIVYPFFITCPRCGVDYCTRDDEDIDDEDMACGDYIELCGGCKRAILCKDCQEEEELPGDTQTGKERPQQVTFIDKCSLCKAWSCADCRFSERTVECILCDRWFCHRCVSDPEYDMVGQCAFCALSLCGNCMVHHRDCPGGIMLRNALQPYLAKPSRDHVGQS